MTGERKSWLVGIGVIGGWTLLLTWPLLFGGRVLYWGTLLLQFAPWRQLVAEAWRATEWPLWTQALGNGAPLLANHQSAVFYPPHLLFLVFPVERALGYSLALHLALAGLFAWLWARQLGLGALGRLVTALAYAGSGFLVGHALFPSMVEAATWLPLLFLLTDRLARHRRVGEALALGAVLGVQFLAGHAQLWYYGAWAIGAYGLYRGWQEGRRAERQVSRTLGRMALWLIVAALVAVGAAAAQILPTWELTANSPRTGGADWDFAMTYSLWPWRLVTLLLPGFFGHPAHGDYWGYGNYFEDNGYLGVLPFILALWAAIDWLRRRISRRQDLRFNQDDTVPFWLAMTAVALALALGKNTPLYPLLFRHAPGFGAFQAPARFLYLYTFAVATLAGIGAGRFRLGYATQYASRLAVVGGAALAVLAWIVNEQLPTLQPTFARATLLFGGLLALSAATLLLRGRDADANPRVAPSPLPRCGWSALVVGLVAGDLLFFGRLLNPTADAALYGLSTASGDYLRAQTVSEGRARIFAFQDDVYDTMFERYTRSADFGPTDLSYLRGLRETLLPNLAVLEGLESANNYEPLPVAPYADLLAAVEDAALPDALRLLGLMNVHYVVSSRRLPGMSPVYSGADVQVYANPHQALPRAWVVYRTRTFADPERLLAELTSPAFDPASEVLLSAGDPLALGQVQASMSPPPSEVRFLHYNANSVTISAVVSQPAYLVFAQTFYPGWQARIDGQPAQILRANHAFCALALQGGEHQVDLVYRPLSFYAGLALSGLTWAALAMWRVAVAKGRARS